MPGEYTIAGGLTDAQRLARQAHVMAGATQRFLDRAVLLDPNLREHGVDVVAGSPFPGVADTGAAAFVEDLGACS